MCLAVICKTVNMQLQQPLTQIHAKYERGGLLYHQVDEVARTKY